MKFRKKKETKPTTSFEDSMKAKAKLNLLEKRYELILEMISEGADSEVLNSFLSLAKLQVVATQGLGELGDSARPSNEAIEGFQELMEIYKMDLIDHGKDSEICKTDETAIMGALVNLWNRSIRKEHTNVEIVTFTPEMFMQGYLQRRGTVETLE